MKLIIEHVEPKVSEWLFIEYSHSAKIWKNNTIFTNVKIDKDKEKLKTIGQIEEKKFFEIFNKNLIILDPKAEKELSPEDFKMYEYLVIGGILGGEVMEGRTKAFISDEAKKHCSNVIFRNIGKIQFPIDQAALVAKRIEDGKRLKDIDIVEGVKIVLEEDEEELFESTVELPYGYVRENGKMMYAPGFIEYLMKGWVIDDD